MLDLLFWYTYLEVHTSPLAKWLECTPNGQGSNQGRITPKTFFNGTWYLLDSHHYKVLIKGKWSNPGKGVVPSPHISVVAIEKGAFGSPLTTVRQHTYLKVYPFLILVWYYGISTLVG